MSKNDSITLERKREIDEVGEEENERTESEDEVEEEEELSKVDNVLEYMNEHYRSVTYEKKEMTYVEWCYDWLETATLNIKTTTRSAYRTVVERHIQRVFKEMMLTEVTTEVIQKFIISLSKGIGIPKPVSNKTVKNIFGVVHKSLSVAVEREYIPFNPADKVKLPKAVRKEPNPMNSNQLVEFLNAIDKHPKRDLFVITILTGIREGEVIGLTWDCFDEINGTLKLYRQIVYNRELHKYEFGTLKNSKTRVIRLPKMAIDILSEKISRRQYTGNSNYIFKNDKGTHFTPAAVYNSLKKVARKIGYPELTFHDLRHTHAVLSLQAKVDPKTVQENLGHHSATFTLDVYCKCLDEMKKIGAEQIERYIKELLKNEY